MGILEIFENAGFEAYIVGGTVRDIVMGEKPYDTDIATSATPEQIIKVAELNNLKWIPTGIEHGTISLIIDGEEIQVTTFRTDIKCDGRHAEVKWTSSLLEDLSRRDFTINAIAMDRHGYIFDPLLGIKDIENKIIRTVGIPEERFNEDILRVLRAIRFAVRFDFMIEKNTWEAIKKVNINELDESGNFVVARERIRYELVKILESPNRLKGFRLLDESGLLKQIIPEIEAMKNLKAGSEDKHPEKDTFIHTIMVLSKLPTDASLELTLAAMLHDIGKPATWDNFHFLEHESVGADIAEEILHRLKFKLDTIEKVTWLIRNHMRIHYFNEMRTAKKIRLIQHPWFDDLLTLRKADAMVDDPDIPKVIEFKNNYKPVKINTQKLITGHDILKMGMKPSKELGDILTEIDDLVLEGTIKTREEALEFAQNEVRKHEVSV